MSISKELLKLCESILNEDKYLLIDKDRGTTISGDTETEKMIVKSENDNISRDDVRDTIEDIRNNLNAEDTDEIASDLEDNAEKLKNG